MAGRSFTGKFENSCNEIVLCKRWPYLYRLLLTLNSIMMAFDQPEITKNLHNIPIMVEGFKGIIAVVAELRCVAIFLAEHRLGDASVVVSNADLRSVPLKDLRNILIHQQTALRHVSKLGLLALRVFTFDRSSAMFRSRFLKRVTDCLRENAIPTEVAEADSGIVVSEPTSVAAAAQVSVSGEMSNAAVFDTSTLQRIAGDVALSVADELEALACDGSSRMSSLSTMTAGLLETTVRELQV
jgi:hypothetical protein